jgi:hypothetical protein
MIKLTAAISPRADWTIAEWQVHYMERHAPLTASVTNFTRHGIRYLQNYVIGAPDVPDFPERDADRSGVTELWFDSVDKIREAYTEPDYFTYLRTDELRFASFDNILAGIAREDELFCSWNPAGNDRAYLSQPRFKIFVFRHRPVGGDRGTLQQAWRAQRAPIMIESEPFKTYVRRYVQTSMLDDDVGMPGEVPHDLIDEFSFDTLADAIAFWGAYRASEQQRAADEQHSDRSKLWMLFARQHEVFGPLPA